MGEKVKSWNKQKGKIWLILILITLIATILAGVAGIGNNLPGAPQVGLAFAANTATGYISVPNSCNFAISNTIVNFGTINPGANTVGTGASGVNSVTVTNIGANPSNVEIEGTSWAYASYSFGVSNTIWNGYGANDLFSPGTAPSATANVEVRSTGSVVDTLLETQNSISQTNTIYLGASVPSLQPGSGASTYQQTISFISSC